MMKEFSMHVMDIIQNSIRAGADLVEIEIEEDSEQDFTTMLIKDNGCGMSQEFIKAIRDPFTTSRTTRKVGLGIPMLEQTCLQCEGSLDIKSEEGVGTEIFTRMKLSNIDRPPMGDIGESIFLTVIMNPDINFTYKHIINKNEFLFNTQEIRDVLGDVPLNQPDVAEWIKANLESGLSDIQKNS